MTTLFHPISGFLEKTLVVAEVDVRKLNHGFTELLRRAIQPALWLLLFGEVFAQAGAVPTGHIPYLDFIAPSILAQSDLLVAIFYGIAVIWERDLGIAQKFLDSPTRRSALVLGKALCDYPDSSDTDFGLIFSCCLFVSGMALGCPEHSATVKPEADINGRLPMLRMGPFHLFRFQLDLRSVSRKR